MKKMINLVFLTMMLPICCIASEVDRTISLLKKLTEAHGASGFEGPVRDILKEEWQPLLPDLRTDGMGNLIGSLHTNREKPKVLIMAHMDEVGFLVRDISNDGFIYMQAVGDWIDPVLIAQRWVITTPKGHVLGYSGAESIHAVPQQAELTSPKQREVFIDIGVRSKEEAMNLGIRPGLPITPEGTFVILQDSRYMAKAFDDRALLAVITEGLSYWQDQDLPVQIVIAATVQEEPGMWGSSVLFEQIKPDIVINLDIGVARDFPLYFSAGLRDPALGKGPTVFVFDFFMIPNDNLVNYVVETAGKAGIPIQYELEDRYGQDGCNMQRSHKGIPTINLGLPVRYAHSHAGIMDRNDYDQMIQLLINVVNGLSEEKIAEIQRF